MSTTQPKFLSVNLQSQTLPLLLRTPTLHDAPAIQALLGNLLNTSKDKTESKAVTAPSLQDIQSRISAWRTAATSDSASRLNLVVVDLSLPERAVCGLSGFGHIATLENGNRSGNVGIMLNPEAREKGYGAEAIRMCVEWGFVEGTLGTLERNVGMMRIVERALVPEGWRRERRGQESGGWEWEFRASRDEWEMRRGWGIKAYT